MIFLQIDPGVSNNLLQYGVLGAFSVLLIGALIFIFKMLVDQQEKRFEQVNKELDVERNARIRLQEKIDNYMEEDREKIMKLMEDILRVLSKVDNKL